MRKIFGFLIGFFVADAALAQENGTRKTDPVIVKAGTPVSGDSFLQPTQISVFEGFEKRVRGETSLGESLDHMAGVDVVSTGGAVGKPVIRGLSGERVKVLSNGIGVDHQQFDARHGPNVDMFLSDRIEVVQGAAGILYGSGAIGGAIDVGGIGIGFGEDGKIKHDGEALFGYATNNWQFDRGLKANVFNDKWSVAAGAIERNGESIRTAKHQVFYPDEPPSAEFNDYPAYVGKLPYTDFDQINRQFGFGYKDGENEYRLRYSKYKTRLNFLLSPPLEGAGGHGHGHGDEGPEAAKQWLANDELQFTSRIGAGAGVVLVPSFSWQNNLREEEHDDETIEVEFNLYTARLLAEHKKFGFFDAGKIGVEYSHKDQESRGSEQLSPGGNVNNYAVFAFEEKQIDKLKLQAGLRHDWREVVAREGKTATPTGFSGNVKREYSAFSGSLGASYQFNDEFVVAGNVGRGFRAPTLFELFSGGMHSGISAVQNGNADLKEEKSLNKDISLRYRSDAGKANLTFYHNEIDNFIYLNDTGTTQNNVAVFELIQDEARIQGVTLDATAYLGDRFELRGVIDIVDSKNERTGEDLALTPSNEYRAELTYFVPDFGLVKEGYLRGGVSYNSSKRVATGEPFSQYDGQEYGTGSTDNYTLIDLAAGFKVKNIALDFEVQNLTDEAYRDFLDSYKGYALGRGRNFLMRARVEF